MARQIAPTPHLVWAAGHFLTFVCGIRYLVGVFLFSKSTVALPRWYTFAYLGALVSYGVVVYNRFGVPQANKAWLQRALMEENVQYLFLALYWWISKPIFVTLLPFVTFSLVHVINFTSKVVIPYAFPGAASASSSSASAGGAGGAAGKSSSASAPANQGLPAKVSKQMQLWIRNNYEHCMRFVSYSEVAIFVRLLIGAILLRNSLLAPLIFAHFLRLRFYMSSFTRASWQAVGGQLDAWTQRSECPPVVRRAYLTLMDLLSRYASSVMSVPQGPAPANGASGRSASGSGAQAATAAGASGSGSGSTARQ